MKRILSIVSILLLVGCATRPNWQPADGSKLSNVKLYNSMVHCRAVSRGAVPESQIVLPANQPTSGKVTVYNSSTGEYSHGTYTTTPGGGGFAGGMASGMANGAALGAAIREDMDRREIYNSCMMANGWADTNK